MRLRSRRFIADWFNIGQRFHLRKVTMLQLLRYALLILCVSSVHADEVDDFDFELEFDLRKKSTIQDFPLQEMTADSLSDAAIEGALQATSAGSGTGKPAYLEQKERSEKKSKEELRFENDPSAVDQSLRFGQSLPQVIPYQAPVFEMDTGRTVQHNNTSWERP